jgi:hypothetical protein
MPWKASSVLEERGRFVARLLDGEAMTEVCRESSVLRPGTLLAYRALTKITSNPRRSRISSTGIQ